MPIYDLICKKCGHEEELFSLSIIDEIENLCPKCQLMLSRKIGAVTAIFKGNGFYATEYGKSKGNAFKKDKSEIGEREKFIEEARKDK